MIDVNELRDKIEHQKDISEKLFHYSANQIIDKNGGLVELLRTILKLSDIKTFQKVDDSITTDDIVAKNIKLNCCLEVLKSAELIEFIYQYKTFRDTRYYIDFKAIKSFISGVDFEYERLRKEQNDIAFNKYDEREYDDDVYESDDDFSIENEITEEFMTSDDNEE